MHYDTIKGGWFWDDFTPVEGPHAFTNFMPGQTRGTTIYLNNCATLLTNLTDSSGFGDLGKWRMEQCSRDGINGLCSSSPGIDLALLYKCVDCLKTGKSNIIVPEYEIMILRSSIGANLSLPENRKLPFALFLATGGWNFRGWSTHRSYVNFKCTLLCVLERSHREQSTWRLILHQQRGGQSGAYS